MIKILINNFRYILKNINFNYEIVNFDSKSVDIILNCYNVHLDFNILKKIENKNEIMSYLKNVMMILPLLIFYTLNIVFVKFD